MLNLPTWLDIDLDALTRNVDLIRHEVSRNVRILLTVKADAYGHGAVQVAQAVEGRVEAFGVATVDEAVELATAGLAKKILILSPILAREIPLVVDHGFICTASSREFVEELSDCAAASNRIAELHVEVDTGMGRTGVLPSEVQDLLEYIDRLPSVRLGGLFTHFPVSDVDIGFTVRQVSDFRAVVERLRKSGLSVPVRHAANSAAIPRVTQSHMDMVRPGLIAYGHLPKGVGACLPVEPVMSWKCRIVQIRELPAGASISYGRSYETSRPTTMGVLPVGYGHGYPFRLSNRGEVIASGRRVPVMGRVTMDMTMVDLTDVVPKPRVGDEVVLMGRQGNSEITVDEIADWAGTISYEILCGISKRVSRTYRREGKVQTFKSLLGVTPKANV